MKKDGPRFPQRIKNGSTVVTIYRLKHPRAADGFVYQVTWYAGGARKAKQFTDYATAKAEAELKAGQLAAGRPDASNFTTTEMESLREAVKLAGNMPLVSAMQEWRRARDLVGNDLLRACQTWSQRHAGQLPKITVGEAIDKFLAAKKADGIDCKASYNKVLPVLRAAMGDSQISAITVAELQAWLNQQAHPVTRNTFRTRIVTLWTWCRKQGFLPRDTDTEADRTERARENPNEIELVTPEQFRAALRLIAEKAPHYIPALVLAGFCGMRRGEVHKQDWRHIVLERKTLRVTSAKKGTPAYRNVPIPEAAIQWLLPYRKKEGPICSNLAIDRIRDICRTASMDLADNGFRHSFISFQVIVSGDVERTAMQAGHTAKVLHKHYRELASEEEAKAWFDIAPDAKSMENISQHILESVA